MNSAVMQPTPTAVLYLALLLSLVGSREQNSNSTSNVTFQLKLYKTPFVGEPWYLYPVNVYINSRVFVQLSLGQGAEDADLRAIPKDCFLAKNSDPVDQHNRHMLIGAGCPMEQSVGIQHTSDRRTTQFSRFSFQVLKQSYFGNNYMFFHCRVTVCSLRGQRELEGLETCPENNFCSEQLVAPPGQLPVESVSSYVSSGPLRPVHLPKQMIADCPPCSSSSSSAATPTQLQQRRIFVLRGLSVPTVVGIAITSFVIGIALTAGLWFIHSSTQPKKLLSTAKRRNNSRDSGESSLDSAELGLHSCPTMVTPMQDSV